MERNTPPINRDDARSARHRLARELAQLVLADPDAPESLKLGLSLGEAGRSISQKISEIVWDVGLRMEPSSTDEQVQRARDLLEYLQLMESGLDSFLAAFKEQ